MYLNDSLALRTLCDGGSGILGEDLGKGIRGWISGVARSSVAGEDDDVLVSSDAAVGEDETILAAGGAELAGHFCDGLNGWNILVRVWHVLP